MPGRFEVQVRGIGAVNAALSRLADLNERAAARALREEAEIEMTEAKRRTPVDLGPLRASGHVVYGHAGLTARLDFGGPSAPYAVYVHEDLEAFHRVGQAKFLESVLLESAPYFAERVARRMARLLGTGRR